MMSGAVFDGLRVLRRAYACNTGCSEVCAAADGSHLIRLQIWEPSCQRDFLAASPHVPVRLYRGALEALLPVQDGRTLAGWLEERAPTAAQRRDTCLSVAAQCIACGLPPCVIALSARSENLRFTNGGVWLQMLPDWDRWHRGMAEPDAVCAVAVLCRELIAPASERSSHAPAAPELSLLIRRADSGDYLDWGQLQRDLSALPDTAFMPRVQVPSRLRRARAWLTRICKPLLYFLAAISLIAAAVSLAAHYRAQHQEQEQTWTGITVIGDQQLGEEAPHG